MSTMNKYMDYCKNSASLQELSVNTYSFIMENFKDVPLTLLRHTPCPGNLEIFKKNSKNSIDHWISSFTNIQSYITQIISIDSDVYYFSSLLFTSDIIYIFVFEKAHFEHLNEVFKTWQSLNEIYKNSKEISFNETKNNYGNLISQLMHDVQSLLELNLKKNDEQLLKRIEYQKSLNKNLLFYIRDFDLFKSDIELKKLLKDSLALMGIKIAEISCEIVNPKHHISVDVELFSKAFNAIIQNALEATESDLSKIQLKVYPVNSVSPFISTTWIAFEILDFGNKISKDFLPYVKNPFFTSKKYWGCSGFGLTNAEKIIKAHNGILEITSESITKVRMLLPEK